MADQPQTHVRIRSLSVRYTTGVQALQDVSFDVAIGEIVTIVGPSGCGKTTLLNVLASLVTPMNAGIHGTVEIQKESGAAGNRIPLGYVLERDGLLPWRTVAKNVALGLEIRGVDHRQQQTSVAELIHDMGLAGSEDAYPHELSAGMRQRAALARTLAVKPSLLIMDEPFGALDVQTRARLHHDLLHRWEQEPFTILLVTHDVDEAIALSHRVLLLSSRPAHVRMAIDVPLSWPRDVVRLRSDATFQDLSSRLWQSLMETN